MRKFYFCCGLGMAMVMPCEASLVAYTHWMEGVSGTAMESGDALTVDFHPEARIFWDIPEEFVFQTVRTDSELGNFSCLWIQPTAVDREFTITITGLDAYPYHTAILDLGSRLSGAETAFSTVRLVADGAQSYTQQVQGWGGSPVLVEAQNAFYEDIFFRNSVAGTQSGAVVTLNHTISASGLEFRVRQVAGDGLGLSFGSYLSAITVPEPSSLALAGMGMLFLAKRHRKRPF